MRLQAPCLRLAAAQHVQRVVGAWTSWSASCLEVDEFAVQPQRGAGDSELVSLDAVGAAAARAGHLYIETDERRDGVGQRPQDRRRLSVGNWAKAQCVEIMVIVPLTRNDSGDCFRCC